MSRRPKVLRVSDTLTLPLEAVTSTFGYLGGKGSGKTSSAIVAAEEMSSAGEQFCAYDPRGDWWGITIPDSGPGVSAVIFGGDHADIPLTATAGEVVARFVAREAINVILDTSELRKADRQRFMADFLEVLYHVNRDPLHLFFDEAHTLFPQSPKEKGGHLPRLLGAGEDVIALGRKRGLGSTLISQRPQAISKTVFDLVDTLIAHRLPGPRMRTAVAEWMEAAGAPEREREMLTALPRLGAGAAVVLSPEFLGGVFERVQFRPKRTYDSSITPPVGQRRRAKGRPRSADRAAVDLDALREQMAALVEEAASDDPIALRQQIAALGRDLRAREQELARERARAERAESAEPQQVSVPVLDAELVARLERAIDALGRPGSEITSATAALAERVELIAGALTAPAREIAETGAALATALHARATAPTAPPATAPPARRPPAGRSSAPAPPRPPAATGGGGADAGEGEAAAITPARQRLLDALAALEGIGVAQVAKTQLALWAGVSPKSSGYQNNLGGLRTLGLIAYPAPMFVALTDDGHKHADNALAASLLTTEELHAHVQQLLPPARWRIVEPLLAAYPAPLTRAQLAEAAGVSEASSGFQNNLGGLRTLGLIDYPQPGQVVATAVLFLETRT
ncbi:MAG: DUF853 family protein [Chloroflexi bacterium]|nr:DUF853 family protein [Chloroflexota bacterium]